MEMDKREYRALKKTRDELALGEAFFTAGDISSLLAQSRKISLSYQKTYKVPMDELKLTSCAIIHMSYQTVLSHFLQTFDAEYLSRFSSLASRNEDIRSLLDFFGNEYPSVGESASSFNLIERENQTRCFFIHEVINANKAMRQTLGKLENDNAIKIPASETSLLCMLGGVRDNSSEMLSRKTNPEEDIFGFLTEPGRLYPDDLEAQLGFISSNWGEFIGADLVKTIQRTRGMLQDTYSPQMGAGGPAPSVVPDFSNYQGETESFSDDRNWMPNVVMLAKNTYVWLDQLTREYSRPITTLDQIPEEELDKLRDRGFNALWLIGLWERSDASRKIKKLCGNPEAEASAYSIKSYNISSRIGGWEALSVLRQRCQNRGIRMASDMVPNHTGLDSDWMKYHKDYFIQQSFKPFVSYSFSGPDLSEDPDMEIKIEDHYYSRSDAAVVFRRIDRTNGETSYVYHGNDGTTMPWNDTAQLNFLNKDTKEAIIRQIIEVARSFPIIRFDAAMTLAKKHIRRLWYPELGTKPDIAGRGLFEMSDAEFNKAMPHEFWREVVDRVAAEVPDTLLLAEAFWMMEGYFVRSLGMHRVYNSAFMNMLKNQENEKYRDTIKKTILFDPEILKRYVNFMNNPDEDPAICQFSDGDRYFGVCTLLSTMPGLPMFGHGQVEGFSEKYGMEYTRAYVDEKPDEDLIRRHESQIFPLLKKRYLFSNCEYFQLFDVIDAGKVADSIFAYTNGTADTKVLVLYNNQYERSSGWMKNSAPKLTRGQNSERSVKQVSVAEALGIPNREGSYVIAKRFASKISYLIPTSKIHLEGLHVELNGYETKVFTDIKVMDDPTGILGKLYEKYGGQAMIEDFELALGKSILSPIFDLIVDLLSSDFTILMHKLINRTLSAADTLSLEKILYAFYGKLLATNSSLRMLDIQAKEVSEEKVKSIIDGLRKALGESFFHNAVPLFQHGFEIISSHLLLQPFLSETDDLHRILSISDTLMLDSGLGTDRYTVHLGALICQNHDIDMLLEDPAFKSLIGANLYQGVVWYNVEAFEDALLAVIIGQASRDPDELGLEYEKKFAFWLKKVHNSKYILDNLSLKD